MIIHQDKFMDFFYMKDLLNLVELYLNNNNLPKEIECCYKNSFSLLDITNIINSLDNYKVDDNFLNKKLGKPYTGNPLKHELIKTIGLKKGIVEMYKNLKNEY